MTVLLTWAEWQVACIAIAVVTMYFLILWKRSGGLWEKKPVPSIPPPSAEQYQRRNTATHPGEAQFIPDFWYGGQFIPGFSPEPKPVIVNDKPIPDHHEAAVNASQDLVQRLQRRDAGARVGDITISSYSRRNWLDSELGCALPGEPLVSAVIPGWLFALRWTGAPNMVFVYHTNTTGSRVKLCQTLDQPR